MLPKALSTTANSRATMGLGAADAIASSSSGVVIATFEKAAYVRFPGGVVAVTAPGVAPGPLHVTSPSVDLTDLAVGARFAVPEQWRLAPAIWRGQLPGPASIDARLLAALAPVVAHSALLHVPLVGRWGEATASATAGDDLAVACRLLGGLGPGLTPSGDDALAGMMLAARIFWPHREDHLVSRAGTVETHEIARAFLIWAARGQSIEPVHRLLAGDSSAAADLSAWGHTSGADLALGLQFGLEHGRAGYNQTRPDRVTRRA